MAGTIIQIKRTANITAPTITDLEEAELAYAQDVSNSGANAILYIESLDSGSNPVIHKVGGKYYTDIVDRANNVSVVNTLVKRDASGNFFAGNISAALFGQANSAVIANTANALTTARDIGLAGDLTGNVSFDGSGNVTLTATIAANSVALGADTTGSYVGNVLAGTGLVIIGDTFTVTNSGSSAYTINSSSNPALTLYRGFTYTFNVSASGHPFWIQSVSGAYSSGNLYSTGVTNNGTQNGTITFVVPANAPATLYYVCQYHSGMAGTINVLTSSENANITLALGASGVTAATYGSSTQVPVVTVDQYGRVTSVSNVNIGAAANVSSFTATGNSFTIGTYDGGSFTANLQLDSIRLGTDTTGAYVGNLIAGTGITITGLGNEGTTPTINNNGVLTVGGVSGTVSNAQLVTSVLASGINTNNVAEGANLYYTDARVYSAVTGNLALKANTADLTTANVVELTNQYFTNARAVTAVTDSLAVKANIADLTTANVAEGTNLYFTNARTYSNVITTLTTSNVAIGTAGGNTTVTGELTVAGNITVNNLSVLGTQTIINSNTISINNAFVFEGTTDNNFETTLTVADPTADRTITLPDASGTLALTSSSLSDFGSTNSLQLSQVITDETGTGNLVFSTSPVLVTPNLGVPSAITLTNATGLPLAGISNLGANQATLLASNAITGITAGVYGNTTSIPSITVDQYGRVTSITSNTVSAASVSAFTRSGNTFTITASGVDYSANIAGSDIPVGTATLGNLISNAVTLTVGSTMANSIAQLNQVLGKLVPASPPAFPSSATLTMSSSTTSSRMAGGFTQFYNSSANTSVAPGTTIAARRAAAYVTSTVGDSGPGDSGTLTLYLNDVSAGSRAFTSGSDNGTYGANLVIADNVDYATKTGAAAGFWESFDANGSGVAKTGWNSVYITHSGASSTSTLTWYYDDSNPAAPTFTNKTFTETSNVQIYSSTVPHYTSATQFTLAANVNNLSGNTYPTSDTFITSSAGGAFQAPTTLTYSAAGVTTPLTQNLYVGSGDVAISTTALITTGFGSSAGGPSLASTNGYNASGSQSFIVSGTPTILYKTGTAGTMEETTLTFGSAVGVGSGLAARIINPGSTDNPSFSASAAVFNSQSSTLQVYDATIVAGTLKHDVTNYATGYIPVGPNLSSGRSGDQYFTFKFVRTSLSKFDIQFTGTIAGLWVAVPGSSIDSAASATNGWVSMATAFVAGVPSVGCATGGTVTLNSAVTNHRKTCTFGTVSSSDTATNEVYIRIKLTSGQSVSALTLQTSSN